jgi:hypothetical protein
VACRQATQLRRLLVRAVARCTNRHDTGHKLLCSTRASSSSATPRCLRPSLAGSKCVIEVGNRFGVVVGDDCTSWSSLD